VSSAICQVFVKNACQVLAIKCDLFCSNVTCIVLSRMLVKVLAVKCNLFCSNVTCIEVVIGRQKKRSCIATFLPKKLCTGCRAGLTAPGCFLHKYQGTARVLQEG
jgi:hypothetical protein